MSQTPRIEKLTRNHITEGFECGQADLDRFLGRYALQAQQSNASQTYLGLVGDEITGFYTLVVGEIAYSEAPERLVKGMARHPVPVIVLARLAVRRSWQGQGVGAGLLSDAIRRTLQVADMAGVRAMVVHAKDQAATAFYSHFDFQASPTDDRHLYALVSDLRKLSQTPNR